MPPFKVISSYTPSGDQANAIEQLADGINKGLKFQTLLGVTGSGKTYTMAKVIEKIQKPTLVLTHNKTLAAQLYREFKEFFPENAVEYFVSYYDYYQPEAYVVSQDLYIEKDASINDEIDRLRLKATSSLVERQDVIIVSSVSCIYGIGNPESFEKNHIRLATGHEVDRQQLLMKLVSIHYDRNDIAFTRGTFRVRGDTVEVFPANLQYALRIVFFGDEIEALYKINPLTGNRIESITQAHIYPAKHYVSSKEEMEETIRMIQIELEHRINEFTSSGRLVEAQRLETRTLYDIEMLRTVGYCNGIENYSRIIDRRQPGQPPHCLLHYFKGNYMMFVDESHVTIPQVRGMYEGDRSRKSNLVEYGFRLPSALDNRPLQFHEFETMIDRVVFVSATPAEYELQISAQVVEQVIRPTGLIDPEIEVRPATGQVDDLIGEIKKRVAVNERILVTTLTKKMAEDLTQYLTEVGLRVRYLHSEIETIERVEIIRDLRKGIFDCLIGINLLREGLDIPEVSLVAILDADKEGFLRSTRSLIQTSGRAARNSNGKVIMYADTITGSMQEAIDETSRRRKLQMEFNTLHNITPKSISKEIVDIIEREYHSDDVFADLVSEYANAYRTNNGEQLKMVHAKIKQDMLEAANNFEFEKAAVLRDQMFDIEKKIDIVSKASGR
ncbi:MAG TPA: excinuclease ABC subunit UvrB [Spirochaetota bacterium]|nr:excinuclease ABC subunit UvrB [Spirochaetota bacterium]HOR94095.1 excinuclease ABC subunit UvrB [Spirochaetota bacterium]HOT18679.1 excinuclease ABC subunit UvrB [Spirochaetota bacterium]HQG41085.1 excinuclease ABC subunit UvrB [Spirochaetota bacterium]HRR60622.1 excinuclease ABC subunit UvrB [Spirochaetota bacterium]